MSKARNARTIKFRHRIEGDDLKWSRDNASSLTVTAKSNGNQIELVLTEIGSTSPKRRRVSGAAIVGFRARIRAYDDANGTFRLPEVVTGWINPAGFGEFYR